MSFSSDDEPVAPAPLLSAAAEELLGVRTSQPRPALRHSKSKTFADIQHIYGGNDDGSPAARIAHKRSQAPLKEYKHTALSGTTLETSPRLHAVHSPKLESEKHIKHVSILDERNYSPTNVYTDYQTPGWRSASQISSGAYQSSRERRLMRERRSPEPGDEGAQEQHHAEEHLTKSGPSSVLRAREEERIITGSTRVKRLGTLSGAFLRGPARRGLIRRNSDDQEQDEPSPVDEQAPSHALETIEEPRERGHLHFDRDISSLRAEVEREGTPKISSPHPKRSATRRATRPVSVEVHRDGTPAKEAQIPTYRVPDLAALRSPYEQENEPPPTFPRKARGLDHDLGYQKPLQAAEIKLDPLKSSVASERKPLQPRSRNTPMRPAPPPPPKMSALETATAALGSASVQAKGKRRNYISVNGKLFTRMECIGRGGSGRVYRVMAENCKMFALKRVSLEDLDEHAVRGFKGEIDLLKKLEKVDRVVRLWDWELNDEKKTLSVLMDIGEMDLKKVIDPKIDEETGSFDITFTRYIWKEMLECVQSVHRLDVVHSDLKPANFVIAQGSLKLIDFGIANAIQDNTVNVHRENQIGTPNYMAPEAILDENAGKGLNPALGKLVRLGKPSDVWSLGCILYQIVYGKPPFGHITSHIPKVMAITNPNHAIQFPRYGVGQRPVPPGLLHVMRRCLLRDPAARPTIPELLGDKDPFLHPETSESSRVPVTQELIAKMQQNIIDHIRKNGMPSESELASWGPKVFANMKLAVDEGRA